MNTSYHDENLLPYNSEWNLERNGKELGSEKGAVEAVAESLFYKRLP